MLGGFTPKRVADLHAKLVKIRKTSHAARANKELVDEFNNALAEAKEAYPDRDEVITVDRVPANIINSSLLLKAKKLLDTLVVFNIESAY